jgi:hypothetical protein
VNWLKKRKNTISNLFSNLLRIVVIANMVSFLLTITLILINSLLGAFVKLSYYFAFSCLLSIGLSIGFILLDSQRIFSKKKPKTKVVMRKSRRNSVTPKRKVS